MELPLVHGILRYNPIIGLITYVIKYFEAAETAKHKFGSKGFPIGLNMSQGWENLIWARLMKEIPSHRRRISLLVLKNIPWAHSSYCGQRGAYRPQWFCVFLFCPTPPTLFLYPLPIISQNGVCKHSFGNGARPHEPFVVPAERRVLCVCVCVYL